MVGAQTPNEVVKIPSFTIAPRRPTTLARRMSDELTNQWGRICVALDLREMIQLSFGGRERGRFLYQTGEFKRGAHETMAAIKWLSDGRDIFPWTTSERTGGATNEMGSPTVAAHQQ
jgi:hypothetical protein